MTNYIHFHTRVRIKEGEFDNFLEAAARFIEAVKSEPGALVCACYADRENQTVTFFELFKDLDAYLAHWEHPPVNEVQPDMIPRVERFERMEVYGNVPPEVIKNFREQSFDMKCIPEHAAFVAEGSSN